MTRSPEMTRSHCPEMTRNPSCRIVRRTPIQIRRTPTVRSQMTRPMMIGSPGLHQRVMGV